MNWAGRFMGEDVRFRDREDAGRQLAARLESRSAGTDAVVLALPRGGVPVAFEVAKRLDLPLDVLVVRKLGAPFEPELAMGAIAGGGIRVINDRIVQELRIPADEIERVAEAELAELERRERRYRGGRPAASLEGRRVILVDDGIATGSTTRVAAAAARARGATAVVVAVPVAPRSTCEELAAEGNEVVCVAQPEGFFGISQYYDSFPQLSDEDVTTLLERADRSRGAGGAAAAPEKPHR